MIKSIYDKISACFELTKPSIQLLVVLTGTAAVVVEGSLPATPLRFILVLLLLGMAGGSANAFNQYFERHVDSQMKRTSRRRPLPMGRIRPVTAFLFATILSVISVTGFWLFFNALSALLALGTILFYSLFYTLYLKPRTSWNIVIGGLAGSMGPIISWAAASGGISLTAVLMFAVIFFWTPPHFWALAVYYKEDYRRVGYPMMPLKLSETKLWASIIGYTLVTLAVSFALILTLPGFPALYALAATSLGWYFFAKTRHARLTGTPQAARGLFGSSIVYLLALFSAIIIDQGLRF